MKKIVTFGLIMLALTSLSGQSLTTEEDLTPEQKYLRTRLNPQGAGSGISMEYAVTGSARLDYGLRFDDSQDDFTQGFLTTIDSSLDISFTFRPDSFSASPRQSFLKRGVYAEIILSDFGVVMSNDAGVDFWENYRIYDNEGNPYLPDQNNDSGVISDVNTEDELTYSQTMFYTGVQVTPPSVEANIHLNPNVYFQVASQPELDFNLATTLGGQGEWAGAETDNSGGFSFILDYPRFFMQASIVSQNYYDYTDRVDTTVQDDEFGGALTARYELSDNLALEGYGSFINFYSADNNDDFYFATRRAGSTVDSLILGGTALTYNLWELAEFGIYGDFAYALGGQFNRGGTDISGGAVGTDAAPDLQSFDGFLYDVRMDIPFPFAGERGVITLSADTYNYSYRDQLFSSDEKSPEIPLDLQLALSYTEERWQFQSAVQAFNILDTTNSLENYLLDDSQELRTVVSGQYTFGNPSRLAFTPAASLAYSTGRLMTEGDYWTTIGDTYTEVYVSGWKDDIITLEASLALEFPQTVITFAYESNQLLPGQSNTPAGSDFTDVDLGVVTVSTVISY